MKEIPGYPGYFATPCGQIFSLRHKSGPRKRPKLMKQFQKPDGYMQTQLRRPNGTARSENVHRLIALAFLPNPESKPTVDHIEEAKKFNFVTGLRWATRGEQSLNYFEGGDRRSYKNGRSGGGRFHAKYKEKYA